MSLVVKSTVTLECYKGIPISLQRDKTKVKGYEPVHPHSQGSSTFPSVAKICPKYISPFNANDSNVPSAENIWH